MLKKTKNSLNLIKEKISLTFKKLFFLFKFKKVFSFILLAVIAGILIAKPETTHAILGLDYVIDWAKSTVYQVVAHLFAGIFDILLTLAKTFLLFCAGVLHTVTSPDFISFTYTGLDNPIIEAGWTIVRDLANVGIVLGLLLIGIATILRIESYQAKKTLPLLIIIALLINFTPVILGVIVDAANILIKFFLGRGADLGNQPLVGPINGTITKWWSNAYIGEMGPVLKSFVLITLAMIGGAILFIFALLFLARYIAIWILVVLSPLAFFFYILPATRPIFSQWWKQFINWCFIGVTAAFFLFLTKTILEKQNELTKRGTFSAVGEVSGTLMDEILPYGVVIAFMIFGLIAGFATSAIGASAVVNFGKKGQKWVGGKAGRGIGRVAEQKLHLKEAVGHISKRIEKTPVARWFLPEAVKKYGEFRPDIEAAQTEAKAYSSKVNADDIMTGAAIGKRAAGKTIETITRGDSQDLFDAGRRKFGKHLSDEQLLQHSGFQKKMRQVLYTFRQGGFLSQIRRDPRLAALLAGQKWAGDYEKLDPEQAILRATSEARGPHIANMERELAQNPAFIRSALGTWDRQKWLSGQNQIKRFQETSLNTIDREFSKFIDDNKLAHEDDEDMEEAWEDYKDYTKAQTGSDGYFEALNYERFRISGWREGQYLTPEERKEKITLPPAPGALLRLPPDFIKKVRERAKEVYKKRQEGTEKGYEYKTIDDMLERKRINPNTPEADEYMKNWDLEQAEEQIMREIATGEAAGLRQAGTPPPLSPKPKKPPRVRPGPGAKPAGPTRTYRGPGAK